jgi:hypothetical protein
MQSGPSALIFLQNIFGEINQGSSSACCVGARPQKMVAHHKNLGPNWAKLGQTRPSVNAKWA